jgi:hypothetical protein
VNNGSFCSIDMGENLGYHNTTKQEFHSIF